MVVGLVPAGDFNLVNPAFIKQSIHNGSVASSESLGDIELNGSSCCEPCYSNFLIGFPGFVAETGTIVANGIGLILRSLKK
jgi:hypothetical protein